MNEAYNNYIQELDMSELAAEIDRQNYVVKNTKNTDIRQKARMKMMFCKEKLHLMIYSKVLGMPL